MAALPASRPIGSPYTSPGTGRFRWTICALLFFAATINYIDRQVIGILKPTLQSRFGWSELDYGDIVIAFQLAYALGYVYAGRLVDRVGTKIGFTLAVGLWSIAAMAHGSAAGIGAPVAGVLRAIGLTYSASVAGFIVVRFALGLGESGNFPASLKAVAAWFPRRERALATGIFNAGTNIGAVVTPLVVPPIVFAFGWVWAFVATGAIGFAWLVAWWLLYSEPPPSSRDDEDQEVRTRVPLRAILPLRQTWTFTLAKFLTDPIWWLYLFWIPDFFSRVHGLSLSQLGPPLVAIYLAADVGSVGGGWLSSTLIRRGWSVNAARKTAMLLCAVAVLPMMAASRVQSLWGAVALISIAAAAHQGWSANLFTFPSDMFPREAVGTVVGIGGMAGAVGGMLIAKVTAYILQATGSYVPVFIIAGMTYLVALAVAHALSPRMEPALTEGS